MEEILNEIYEKYNKFLQNQDYNRIVSGKKVLKEIRIKITNEYRLGKFSLEDLSNHLNSLIYDYISFENGILNRADNQGMFKSVASVYNGDSDEIKCIKDEVIPKKPIFPFYPNPHFQNQLENIAILKRTSI